VNHLLLLAALVCCQAGMDDFPGYHMCKATRRCASWGGSAETIDCYDKARMMALIIEHSYKLPHNPRFGPFLTANNIMGYDIYGGLTKLRKSLMEHGVVSEYGNHVGAARDVLDGVYLPMYLFLDSVLKDKSWRDICPRNKIWISLEEKCLFRRNARLVE
jgi:hypothetical protein